TRLRPPLPSPLFPYTTLFRSITAHLESGIQCQGGYNLLHKYARVSTGDQDARLQHDALTAAGCYRIFTDAASSSLQSRAELDKRSEEHTSELQSRFDIVCRLL